MSDIPPLFYALFSLLVLWSVVLTFLYWKAVRHYNRVVSEAGAGDIKDLWEQHLHKVEGLSSNLKRLEVSTSKVQESAQKHLQKASLVRFNPFGEVGGNQSFAVALLDGQHDGVVISSLHGREGTRIYGKPVKAGQEVGHAFSDEEREAVKKAMTA